MCIRDRLLRVCEKLDTAMQRDIPAATNFLSKREQMLVCEVLRGAPVRFFGGLSTAEREISCYLPDYLDEDWLTGEDGPVAAVRAAFFERDTLTHRDFLGALMGCGIKRETVGDIYVAEGRCNFLVTRDILPYVLQNLTDAGRTRLHLEDCLLYTSVFRFIMWNRDAASSNFETTSAGTLTRYSTLDASSKPTLPGAPSVMLASS